MTHPTLQPHLAPDDVISSAALRASGVTAYAISARCRPSGPWQRPFPGVVLLSNAPPTRRQRLRAALIYAGAGAILTGTDAIHAHGLQVPESDQVLVLIPATRRVASRSYLTVERTTRLPTPVHRTGLPVAPLVRATVDAARHQPDTERMRALLRVPVEDGRCTIADLRRELDEGNQRGSAAVRAALSTRDEDVVPVALGLAKRVLRAAPLPPPRWQVPLHTSTGTPLGVADAWWQEAGLAWNLGTQQHPLPTAEHATATLTTAGITVLNTDPTRLRTSPSTVITELVAAFTYASTNPYHR